MSDYFKNSSLENTTILIVYPFNDFLSEAYNLDATNPYVSYLEGSRNISSYTYGEFFW